MNESIKTSDLCINCINSAQCSYCLNSTKPIIFCEEFSSDESVESHPISGKRNQTADFIESLNSNSLCSNCENIETCGLQKTNSPVVHCEGYR
ncbi:MAG: hypothetical protein GY699_11465 [Desulfobacteraceae bacterium]|nr:hypothetical protein [Desulfobacteraceae bacterium]